MTADSIKLIVISLLLVLISPFIINCFFAYPQTDDFAFSTIARDMGFLKSQYHWYTIWTGRFTSTALLSINPLVYGSFAGYNFILVILILVQFASMYLLIDAITKNALSWQEKLIFTLLLLFAFLNQMDDVRSGLYWMAGVITYQVAETLLLLFGTLILYINNDLKHDNMHNKCLVIILAILLGGTNEIVLVLVLLVTSFVTFYSYAIKKNVNLFQITTLIAVGTGGGIGLLAPGNFARISTYRERENILSTVWNALNSSLTSIEVWITSPLTLILMCMVLFAVVSNHQLKTLFSEFKIVDSVCVLLFIIFMSFFIPYWSTGMPPQNRVMNMIYLFFMIGWMINLVIIFARFEKTIVHFIKMVPIKSVSIIVITFIIALFSFGSSNFILVSKDLLSGDSFRYHAEMQQRKSQIINSDKDVCILNDILNTPRSLYFFFVGYDSNYWVNQSYASYFKKKSIVLIKK